MDHVEDSVFGSLLLRSPTPDSLKKKQIKKEKEILLHIVLSLII